MRHAVELGGWYRRYGGGAGTGVLGEHTGWAGRCQRPDHRIPHSSGLHRGWASAIRWMSARTSGAPAGRPGPVRRLFQVHNSLKPARCQRMTVSGWTMATASAQPCHRRESQTQKRRSHGRKRGRAAVRRRTASWWRQARFSSIKAWWVLTRGAHSVHRPGDGCPPAPRECPAGGRPSDHPFPPRDGRVDRLRRATPSKPQ